MDWGFQGNLQLSGKMSVGISVGVKVQDSSRMSVKVGSGEGVWVGTMIFIWIRFSTDVSLVLATTILSVTRVEFAS